VGMAQVGQVIQENGYEKPFFMAYVAHSFYLWFFPAAALMYCWIKRKKNHSINGLVIEKSGKKFPFWKYIRVSLVVAVIVFFMLYMWYASLSRTSVAVNTSIYQCNSVFVYIFSICLFKESITALKVLSVLICLGGVFMISFGDSGSGESANDAIGYVLLISSTFLYALYEVVYKYIGVDPEDNKTEAFYHALLVLAWIGIFTAILFWPGLLLLHYTGWEPFVWPQGTVLLNVFLMALFESLCNLCLLTGIFLTSPLFICVGSMLTVPTAILTDFFLGKLDLSILAYMGIFCIVLGFCGLNYAEYRHSQRVLKHL